MTNTVSRRKTLIVFILTIIAGYILFILPDVFFGVTKINGGKQGINLMYIAIFQFVTVTSLLWLSLKKLKRNFKYIGLKFKKVPGDLTIGLLAGLTWTAVQFIFLIPNTGGAAREDISGMLDMMGDNLTGMLFYIVLGVLGGGVTEELFNRGYFIIILRDVFKNEKTGTFVAAFLSILLFALGHLPTNIISWVDILVPTLIYTSLFLYTKRLIAPIAAHAVYNLLAIILVYFMYGQ
ncbi:hypothetical protein GCM10007424_22050 [Flavobacterium suaedae]|uniref:CAAX prenyl protease 2/Lysostaphin resistance protein A-like domain-containing protein n=1 Tax=Flavobacterium suaedae TaxID=1767027 RepID=A0ABQ1JXV7_9FLAO|nr:type II CAAX endopeptidase family protein [Flavobacterium suaedae]GGB81534.1 hypothetical protein GCM10007424_22050 [Flavobacterium suaedae]